MKIKKLKTIEEAKTAFKAGQSIYVEAGADVKTVKKQNANEAKRIIDLDLTDKRYFHVLKSIMGQLSDGMWENDPRMEPYWLAADPAFENGKVVLKIEPGQSVDGWGRTRTRRNPYFKMSDSEIGQFFANKIKALVAQYFKDYPDTANKAWRKNNDTCIKYMRDYDTNEKTITIGDAFTTTRALLSIF